MSELLPRCWGTPAGIAIGPADAIPDGGACFYRLEVDRRRFSGLIARSGAELFGYVDQCPHASASLGRSVEDDPIVDGLIQCHWHSARFETRGGYCVSGPCHGRSLTPWPIVVEDGYIVTA